MNDDKQWAAKNDIVVGVSACLLGAAVRFDGGHKRDTFVCEQLGAYFTFKSFCPEVAIGLTTPRQPIRLVQQAGAVRVLGTRDSSFEVTSALTQYSQRIAAKAADLSGFIFKKDSPSCGMARVKVYNEQQMPERTGVGVFAAAIKAFHPLLPTEEEGRLNDPTLRENFVNRVYTYARWQKLSKQGLSKARLLAFHTQHKYRLLAHNPEAYRKLGRLLSHLQKNTLDEIANEYITVLMGVLQRPASRNKHVNVLQHLAGFLKKNLDALDRANVHNAIDAYAQGEYPLIVPITLLRHHFSKNRHAFVQQQVYLNPHPRALGLMNTI